MCLDTLEGDEVWTAKIPTEEQAKGGALSPISSSPLITDDLGKSVLRIPLPAGTHTLKFEVINADQGIHTRNFYKLFLRFRNT